MKRLALLALLLVLAIPAQAGSRESDLEQLERAAALGDEEAAVQIGLSYWIENGTCRDRSGAEKWLRPAAEHGHREAGYRLGMMYAFGDGLVQDAVQAAAWFAKAAEQGQPDAQYMLGLAYAAGSGIPEDKAQAAHWFERAARQGIVGAQTQLGLHQQAVDPEAAALWLLLAAKAGSGQAQQALPDLLARLPDDRRRKVAGLAGHFKATAETPVYPSAAGGPPASPSARRP